MYNNRQLYHLDCHEFVVILGISMNCQWKAIDPDGPDDDEDDFARDDARSAGKSAIQYKQNSIA